MAKKRAVVICPGRGSYSREERGYLNDVGKSFNEYLQSFNDKRSNLNLKTISELDNDRFRSKTHMVGGNASPLIYSCSINDFMMIDKNKYEIVALCGNSMGWYTALALSGSIGFEQGYDLIQEMGSLTEKFGLGGQIIYPIIDDEWQINYDKRELLFDLIQENKAHISIYLGGYIVIAGNQECLNKILDQLPKNDKYPFQIPFHSAFHTPLLQEVTTIEKSSIQLDFLQKPKIPLVDGRGCVWSPWSTSTQELFDYTLNFQVLNEYNFSSSVSVCLKEFCPDKIILLGPGNSLGGPVAQILISENWNGLKSKNDFVQFQDKNPFVLSMGINSQRLLVK